MMHLQAWQFLRHDAGGPGGEEPGQEPTSQAEAGAGGRALRCVQCRLRITSSGARMEMQGQHRHVFFNPHGHMFELGCFGEAPGCAVIGAASEEFSWFPGHAWRVAVCGRCGLHMGWLFTATAGGALGVFWGLILPHLVEDEDGE